MIESATVFRKCSDARYRNIGGEGIVVRQTAGEVLVLNGVGARVLDLLGSGAVVGDPREPTICRSCKCRSPCRRAACKSPP